MAQMYRIKNWARFQHYKERNPPWVKLHAEILASEDWVTLDDASKLLMLVCMVVAAKHEGCVPDNPGYIRRVAYLSKTPNLKPLVECGFLELQADASNAERLLANARPEKEADTETEEESILPDRSGPSKPKSYPDDFEEFWKAYPTDSNMPKKLAFVQWKKLSKEKRDAAIAAIPAFRRYCEKNKSWYRVIYADRFLSQEKFEGYAAEKPPDPEELAARMDRADRLLHRGKYAPEAMQ